MISITEILMEMQQVISLRSLLCCDITQRRLVVTDVSEQPTGSTFNSQAVLGLLGP
jgi:hypothetical protein